jgi:hypothetical protein
MEPHQPRQSEHRNHIHGQHGPLNSPPRASIPHLDAISDHNFQQKCQSGQDHAGKLNIILAANTVINPFTVMVEVCGAAIAPIAVETMLTHQCVARGAGEGGRGKG